MKTFLYLVCLSLPLFAAVGLVIFMAGGKGKPKPTQMSWWSEKRST